jgi:hypothetical protein
VDEGDCEEVGMNERSGAHSSGLMVLDLKSKLEEHVCIYVGESEREKLFVPQKRRQKTSQHTLSPTPSQYKHLH